MHFARFPEKGIRLKTQRRNGSTILSTIPAVLYIVAAKFADSQGPSRLW